MLSIVCTIFDHHYIVISDMNIVTVSFKIFITLSRIWYYFSKIRLNIFFFRLEYCSSTIYLKCAMIFQWYFVSWCLLICTHDYNCPFYIIIWSSDYCYLVNMYCYSKYCSSHHLFGVFFFQKNMKTFLFRLKNWRTSVSFDFVIIYQP